MKKKRRARRRPDGGLTLLEMMIVLALIGLIAGTIGTQIYKRYREAQIRTAKLQARELVKEAQLAMIDDGACPTLENLAARSKATRDPWGTTYTLVCPSAHEGDPVDVTSPGPDKQSGTADDINSWKL
jgi:general secretion pathway protein G